VQIHSLITAAANAASATSSTTPSTANPEQATNSMFMDLLTAQLENQSPLNPVDPTQFTSQLVQFNMLDQLTQINNTLQQAATASTPTSGHAVSPISGGN
jgi:flagellar basal-body rod modification protein FlgD